MKTPSANASPSIPRNPTRSKSSGWRKMRNMQNSARTRRPRRTFPGNRARGGRGGARLDLRPRGAPAALSAAIRQAVREVDENLPINNIRTQVEQADQTLALERLFAKLVTLFGLLAQQLASIGLF